MGASLTGIYRKQVRGYSPNTPGGEERRARTLEDAPHRRRPEGFKFRADFPLS
jgi:hypothetical protein